jgi:glycosyltransferase involved in cell wall biosynthesis
VAGAKLSVVICSYNYGRYLSQCLSSALQQTRAPDEVVVVDDGSTDDTAEAVRTFDGVRYLRQDHAGKAAAFERGVQASSGDVICHLDADDYWMPSKLARVEALLDAFPEVDAVVHQTSMVDAAGRTTHTQGPGPVAPRVCSLSETLVSNLVYLPDRRRRAFGAAGTVCIRRRGFDDLRPIPAGIGGFVDYFLVIAAARRGIVCTADLLAAYRQHGRNYHLTPDAKRDELARHDWFLANSVFGAGLSVQQRRLLEASRLEDRLFDTLGGGTSAADAASARALVKLLCRAGVPPGWKHWALALAFPWVRAYRDSRTGGRDA